VAEPVEATTIGPFPTMGVSMLRQAQQPQAQRPRFAHKILWWLSLSKPLSFFHIISLTRINDFRKHLNRISGHSGFDKLSHQFYITRLYD